MLKKFTPFLLLAVLVSCTTAPVETSVPLFDGLGTYSLPVTTSSPEAQRYFDQGLALCHGFNHDEAARAFEEAVRIDPGCGMAYWGIAYALGPNYNLWDEGEAYSARANAALKTARALAPGLTPLEGDLIRALSTRFSDPMPKTRKDLNQAYVAAMKEVWQRYPEHAEVGCLYADALLCQHPWDQWAKDGRAKRNTLEIKETLERVLTLNTEHPGANHLYIHTMESSQTPELAEAAADRLGALMPGSGHLVHMPSHIYMRVGRYDDAVRVNAEAASLDRAYFKETGTVETPGIYHGYHLHNHHFLIWSAMFQGRLEDALDQYAELKKDIPASMADSPYMADWYATPFHILVRFGRWEEILKTPQPPENQPYAVAIGHYARGIALANVGRIEEARQEAALLEKVAVALPKDLLIHVVPADDIMKVARAMLLGEIAYKAGQKEAAFRHLTAAVAAEDALRYTEPNPWMMPSRHALGALLLESGRVAEAERHYRDDLRRYPKNGWALHGLAECLERQGKTAEAERATAAFEAAWSKATVKIPGSCFCRTQ